MDIQINLNNPQIYIFNGTSSSGKTTLAKALMDRLDYSYTYLSLDNYIKST
jgi:uridine kinase